MEPVYAPKYPLFAEEGWWVLVGDLNRKTIFSFERITDNGRVVSKEVRFVCRYFVCVAIKRGFFRVLRWRVCIACVYKRSYRPLSISLV